MAVVMRQGGWKLVNNLGVGYAGKWADVENKELAELFRIKKDEQGSADLGEQTNLADKFPKIRDAMLREMDEFLNNAKVSMPYKNIIGPKVTQAEKQAHPQILALGSEKDQIWATFESGSNKASIKEAHLLYTLNPKEFDKTRGHREEWFKAPAKISNGRVEASMPPGATHAVFCMRDENGFLITSEELPDFQVAPYGSSKDSSFLENGYAYKPGMYALIELGKVALKAAKKQKLSFDGLEKALNVAQKRYQSAKIEVVAFSDAIRSLRAEIRKLETVPQSRHFTINRFPSEPLF
jgi:hypothetical protein